MVRHQAPRYQYSTSRTPSGKSNQMLKRFEAVSFQERPFTVFPLLLALSCSSSLAPRPQAARSHKRRGCTGSRQDTALLQGTDCGSRTSLSRIIMCACIEGLPHWFCASTKPTGRSCNAPKVHVRMPTLRANPRRTMAPEKPDGRKEPWVPWRLRFFRAKDSPVVGSLLVRHAANWRTPS